MQVDGLSFIFLIDVYILFLCESSNILPAIVVVQLDVPVNLVFLGHS